MGLLLEPVSMEKYKYIRMNSRERWVVAMHPDSPLAVLERITPEDLKGLPLILPRRLDVQSEIANWFGDDFEKLNVFFTSNLIANSSVMVHSRLAYSIVIQGSITFWDREKITYRPLEPELTADSVLAWKRKQPFGPAASRFISFAREKLKSGGRKQALRKRPDSERHLPSGARSFPVQNYCCSFFLYSVPHASMASRMGFMDSPRGNREYSTRGGTSG